MKSSIQVRLHHYLDAVVLFFLKSAVSSGGVAEIKSMSYHKGGIYFPVLNKFQQRAKIFVNVRLAHLEGKTFRKRSAERKLIEKSAVDSRHGNSSTFAARTNCLAKRVRAISGHIQSGLGPIVNGINRGSMRFKSYGIDA
jgi:hypothetical protein